MAPTGVRVKGSLRRSAHAALVIALLLASNVVSALGLGQLEMRSKIGEPFLAEIPIVSSDPAELEQLVARVPTAETFARIGLQGPDAIVSSLRFVSALDAQGRPVIRVTSEQPINEPLLTFLVEVDWGQGRLVREYSALVAAPRTVDAPLQPAIQAPVAAPSNAIVREPVVPVAAPAPVVSAPPQPAPAPRAVVPTPSPLPPPVPEAPPVAPTPVAVTPAPSRAPSTVQSAPVRPGDSLSEIARDLELGVSLDQAMIALLRANPEAFINGDINQLKRGAVLRVPQPAELSGVDAQEASELVRTQMARFQESRRPVVAPEMPLPAAQTGTSATPSAGSVNPPASQATPAPARPAAATPRRNRARLEIVPPGASQARQAGTQSGVAAGGEGAMLRQEMDQARETLAARDVELTEMRARVAELERLQAQQQQLIALKDSQLATAQQRVAQAQQAPATAKADPWPWVLGGAVLLAMLAIAAFLARRQSRARRFQAPGDHPAPRPRSIADAFGDDVLTAPTPARGEPDASGAPARAVDATSAAVAPPPAGSVVAPVLVGTKPDRLNPASKPPRMSDPLPSRPASPAPADVAPAAGAAPVRSAATLAAPPAAAPSAPAGPTASPTWHAASRTGAAPIPTRIETDAATALATDTAVVESSRERLELARAYLDLGDHASARQLLGELVVSGDHASRQQATRLLRELD